MLINALEVCFCEIYEIIQKLMHIELWSLCTLISDSVQVISVHINEKVTILAGTINV